MTLLTIAQNTLREIPGFEVPASIIGNENETAVLSLALINRALLEVRRRSNWDQLTVRHTVTTVATQEEYPLPSDFKKFITMTWWDKTNRWPVEGPVTAAVWEALKTSIVTGTIRRVVRIFKGATSNDRKIFIFPTPPTSGDEITLEYISDGLVQDTGGTLKTTFTADTDVSLLDEDVVALCFKWRFLQAQGQPYVEEFRDCEAAIADLIGDNGGGLLVLGQLPLRTNRERFFRTQEGNF